MFECFVFLYGRVSLSWPRNTASYLFSAGNNLQYVGKIKQNNIDDRNFIDEVWKNNGIVESKLKNAHIIIICVSYEANNGARF